MTVGIVLSNGVEAILLCDEMVTAGGRQSSSVTKLAELNSDVADATYHGALVGAGSANIISEVIASASNGGLKGKDLEDSVSEVSRLVSKRIDEYDNHWLSEQFGNSVKKAELFSDPQEKAQFLNSERARIFQQFDQFKAQQQGGISQLLVAAYERAAGKARIFLITGSLPEELHLPHLEIGSGGDAAQLYLLEQLQGFNTKHLQLRDMATLVAGAYMKSTLNVGVGGTPKMVVISKEGLRQLGPVGTFLTNICGYYFAGALNKGDVNSVAEAATSKDSSVFSAIRRDVIGKLQDPGNLELATLPLSVIYGRVNWRERI